MSFIFDNGLYFFLLTLLVLVFVERLRPRRIMTILLFALLAVALGLLLIRGFYYLINDGYGIISSALGGTLAVIIWTFFARLKLEIRFRILPLVALLPVFYVGTYFMIEAEIRRLEAPKRLAEFNASTVKMDLGILVAAAEKYKSDCGKYPENLKKLTEPNKRCKKWTGYKQLDYRDGDAIRDPWRRQYNYKIIDSDTIEVSTFGADGVSGGEGENMDRVFRSSKASK